MPAIQELADVAGAPVDLLLTSVASGDQHAFTDLYDDTSRRIYGLVKRVLVDAAQAEEVSQEVFLEVWQKAPRFDGSRGAAMSWMLTIAHKRAIDRVRASQSSRNRDLRIGIRDHEPSRDDVETHVEVKLEGERVRLAMLRLTVIQREAIDLSYFGGLTSTEIAQRLGVPVGTVKTRLRDGLIRLRELLSEPRERLLPATTTPHN